MNINEIAKKLSTSNALRIEAFTGLRELLGNHASVFVDWESINSELLAKDIARVQKIRELEQQIEALNEQCRKLRTERL